LLSLQALNYFIGEPGIAGLELCSACRNALFQLCIQLLGLLVESCIIDRNGYTPGQFLGEGKSAGP